MNKARNTGTRPAPDQAEILRALGVLFRPGDVVELRVLDAVTPGDRRLHVESGYFDDWDKLAQAAVGIPKAKGWYVTINPVNPALLARAQNRVRPAGRDPATGDKDIPKRLWLPIDLDAVRPAGISATDAEHEAAIQVARDIFRFLVSELGWPEPVIGDSGNGAHVIAAIDLPADDGGLVERCLKALAARFDTATVKVDTSTHNPARIWKLYGTLACKGDHTPDRPHRLARLLYVPGRIEPVPIERLQALAAEAESPAHDHAQQPRQAAHGNGVFDLAQWIAEHSLDVIGPEPWQDGRRWVFPVCPWNPDHTNRSAFIVQHGNGAIGAGCHHNGCQGKGWHDLRDVVEPGWRERRGNGQSRSPNAGTVRVAPVLVRLTDVKPEPVRWLWPGRIALGKVTLIAGDPGLGKSFLTLDLAARVTRADSWPDDLSYAAPLGGVVLLSAEDDLADTVRPRLDAAGAEVSRVLALTAVCGRDGDGDYTRAFDLSRDLPHIEAALDTVEDCRLVVIDPVSAYLGKTDSHKNAEIRSLLAPLAELAGRRRIAVVAVTHLRKGEGPAVYRAMGSLAFVAAARAVWGVVADPQDPARRLFLPVKNNLGPDASGLAYRLAETGGVPKVEWDSEPVNVSADQAMGARKDSAEGSALAEAVDWLREALADGPVKGKEVKERAHEDGIAPRTLDRAKKKLGVIAGPDGFRGPWVWRLPEAQSAPRTPECANPETLAHSGDTGAICPDGPHDWGEIQ